jgi:hypothetical protein
MMVESTHDRARSDGADALNWTPQRREGTRGGCADIVLEPLIAFVYRGL